MYILVNFGEITLQLGLLWRSRSSKVTNFCTNQKLICDFLLVINTNLPCDDQRKIFTERPEMDKVPNGVETLPKISIASVGCRNVTDRQTTDGRMTTYSERSLKMKLNL